MIQILQLSKRFSYNKDLQTDHTLITYAGLGHDLSPAIGDYPGSSMYGLQQSGPIKDYALADLYSWLEAHSGLSHPYIITTSTIGANTSSSSKR